MRRALGVIALTGLASGAALAQRTGTLLRQTDSTRRVRRLFDAGASAAVAATRDTVFAALVFDPSLAAPARSSAWAASVVPAGPSKEVRLQVNLCDVAGATCGATGASSLMLAGPLNSGDDFTELADLDGLVGAARVQASWTSNVTSVGRLLTFAGTYSQPSFAYRDSAALGRRSVSHAAYAVDAGAGYRWPSFSLQAGVRWEQAYRPKASQNLCSPAAFGPAGSMSCATLVVGAPSASVQSVAHLSGSWSIGGNAAARLTISHDLRHAVTGVDLPVWVMPNAAGGLAGGVRFGYRTDARECTVALFVSQFKL